MAFAPIRAHLKLAKEAVRNPMNTKQTAAANLALLLAATLWGGGFVASKVALSGWTPFAVLALRFGLAALLTGVLFRRRLGGTTRDTARRGIILGALILLAFSLQLTGLRHTSSAKASFLCTSYVVLVPFLSWGILRHRPGVRAVAAGILAFLGIGIISLNEAFVITPGDALCLLYNLPYGLALVLIGQFSTPETDSIQMTFFQFLTIAVLALALCVLTGADFRCRDLSAVPGVLYLSIACTLVAMLLQNTAQRHTSSVVAALLISLESVFGFSFSLLYFQEPVTPRMFAGSALCFGAILICNWRPKEARQS